MITLKSIKASDSSFGQSFGGKNGPTKFYKIIKNKEIIGEIEFDTKQSEILSIYIDNAFRGGGVGSLSIKKLFEIHNIDKIYVWSAKTSLKFWKKLATKEIKKDYFLIEN